MPTPPPNGKSTENRRNMQALVKAEKLTQIAFVLPVSLAVGWLLGAGLDKLLHQSWIYLAGIVLGVVAGFVQVFRMISGPGMLEATAYDPNAGAGPGYQDRDDGPKP